MRTKIEEFGSHVQKNIKRDIVELGLKITSDGFYSLLLKTYQNAEDFKFDRKSLQSLTNQEISFENILQNIDPLSTSFFTQLMNFKGMPLQTFFYFCSTRKTFAIIGRVVRKSLIDTVLLTMSNFTSVKIDSNYEMIGMCGSLLSYFVLFYKNLCLNVVLKLVSTLDRLSYLPLDIEINRFSLMYYSRKCFIFTLTQQYSPRV